MKEIHKLVRNLRPDFGAHRKHDKNTLPVNISSKALFQSNQTNDAVITNLKGESHAGPENRIPV
jgi:hypothetical protein